MHKTSDDIRQWSQIHVRAHITEIIEELMNSENPEISHDAATVFSPVIDWQGSAEAKGWRRVENGFKRTVDGFDEESYADYWAKLCLIRGYHAEESPSILEVWIVSSDLASHLLALEQRVIKVAGHWCWGRYTSGQAVWSDTCIEQAYDRMIGKP